MCTRFQWTCCYNTQIWRVQTLPRGFAVWGLGFGVQELGGRMKVVSWKESLGRQFQLMLREGQEVGPKIRVYFVLFRPSCFISLNWGGSWTSYFFFLETGVTNMYMEFSEHHVKPQRPPKDHIAPDSGPGGEGHIVFSIRSVHTGGVWVLPCTSGFEWRRSRGHNIVGGRNQCVRFHFTCGDDAGPVLAIFRSEPPPEKRSILAPTPCPCLWQLKNNARGGRPKLNNIVRVRVKASWAEGPRRFHTNTVYAHFLGSQPAFQLNIGFRV